MKRVIIGAILFFIATVAYTATVGNLKYEVVPERIVISCVDHKAPSMRLLNPVSGPVLVVDCEREK